MELLFVSLGVLSGVISGLFGLGGGTVIVPSMLSVGMEIQHAIGISVIQMVFASVFGAILNYKNKVFELKDGVVLGIGGLFGASFSGLIVSSFSAVTLNILFLMLTIYSLFKFITKKKQANMMHQHAIKLVWKKNMILLATGALTGIFAISLGIGGGLLIVPILSYYLGFDTKKCTALSLFFIIFSSISGAFSFLRQGIIDQEMLYIGLLVGMASIVGVSLGIYWIKKISTSFHKRALICVYIVSISVTTWHLLEKLELL